MPFARLYASDRKSLWNLVDDDEFIDCLATMNHAALPSLKSRRAKLNLETRPSNTRRAELTLYRYLTRFCSRNDTTGTGGTTFWGELGESTELIPAQGKSRVVWVSPRHAELLCHQAAHGPLRQRATAVLFPRYRRENGRLVDSHTGETVHDGTTLRLGRPDQDPLELLLELSPGTELEGPLRQLVDLKSRLEASRSWEFARLMEEADQVADGLVNCELLDFPQLLRHLVQAALEDPAMQLELAPGLRVEDGRVLEGTLLRRKLSPREEEALARPDRTHRLEVITLLAEGILAPAGTRPVRSGIHEMSRTLFSVPLSEPLASMGRLLTAAWSSGPVTVNPVAAEAELASLLGEKREQFVVAGVDRSFFICDSARQVSRFSLGGRLRQRIETQLEPWFRLAAWQEYNRERVQLPILRSLPADDVPLSRFLDDLHRRLQKDESDFETPELMAMRAQLIAEDDAKWTVGCDPASMTLSLHESGGHPGFDEWLRDKRLVTSLDLMLGGTTEELEAGGGLLLVSEAHCGGDGLSVTSFYPQAHPGRSLAGHVQAVFGEDTLFLQPPMPTKQLPGILLQLQDAVLAINNPESFWPQTRTVPLGQLRVRREGQFLTVHDGERSYRTITEKLSVGNVRTVGYSPLSIARWACSKIPGFTTGGPLESFPEIRLNGLVISRATHRVAAGPLGQFLAQDPTGKLVQQALKLPRFVFVKTSKKPMLCDFESAISVEVLIAEVEKAHEVLISPMQPGPEQLWLQLDDGAYASELRMMAICDGPDFASGPEALRLRL